MHRRQLPILLILAGLILLITGGVMQSNQDIENSSYFIGVDTQAACLDRSKWPSSDCRADPSCCGIWDGQGCRTGQMRNGQCQQVRDYLPMTLYVLGVLAMIAAVIVIVVNKRN